LRIYEQQYFVNTRIKVCQRRPSLRMEAGGVVGGYPRRGGSVRPNGGQTEGLP
jgi:hypothetical protein